MSEPIEGHAGLTSRALAWRELGGDESFRGRRIHVLRRPGEGPLVLFLHGFPSSSYDFREVIARLGGLKLLAFDMLGFGLSEKPREHRYSLLWQADLATELVAREGAGRPVLICAHDMGTSVATELLARDLAGRLPFELAGALLFNGSIVLEAASLTPVQRLLRSPLGPLVSRLVSERLFAHQFGELFSDAHPLSEAEAADQWSLIAACGGNAIADRLIHYLGERRELADRWHGAVRDWPGELRLAWGMLDPVATPRVLEALIELRPTAPVERLADLGHYPQLEAPEAIATLVRTQLRPLL